MFARRNRKRKEDDDQLVPHGFLWQATDEISKGEAPPPVGPPPKPVELKPPLEIPTVSKAEIPAQPVSVAEHQSDVKLGAISPPLQWPSPNIQGVRRPQGPSTSPSAPAVLPATPLPAPLVREEPRPKLEVVKRREKRPWIRPAMVHVRAALTESVTRAGSLGTWSSDEISLAATNVRKKLRAVEIANKLSTFCRNAGQRSSTFFQKARPLAGAGALQVRRLGAALAQASVRAHRDLASSYQAKDFNRAGAFLKRAWDFKLTIRIPQRSTGAAPWRTLRLRFARDSRLRTSLGMAGLSALLTLALVMTVQHYGETNLPSKVFAQPESKIDSVSAAPVVQPAAVIEPAKPTPAAGVELRKSHPSRKVVRNAYDTRPALRIKAAAKRAAASKRPRAHYSEDDDYVARDTTVYYGTAGKPTR